MQAKCHYYSYNFVKLTKRLNIAIFYAYFTQYLNFIIYNHAF